MLSEFFEIAFSHSLQGLQTKIRALNSQGCFGAEPRCPIQPSILLEDIRVGIFEELRALTRKKPSRWTAA